MQANRPSTSQQLLPNMVVGENSNELQYIQNQDHMELCDALMSGSLWDVNIELSDHLLRIFLFFYSPADIPLEKVRNVKLRDYLSKRLRSPVPSVSSLLKIDLPR